MKTIKPNFLFLMTLGFIFLSSWSLQAQANIPYSITNNLNCYIRVMYVVDDANCSNSSCDSGGFFIPANSSVQILSFGGSCGSSTQACDLTITITSIGGTSVSYAANSSNVNTQLSITAIAGCTGSSPYYMWSNSNFDVFP